MNNHIDHENTLGPRGTAQIDSDNRGAARKWLTAMGVPSAKAYALGNGALMDAYNDTSNATLESLGGKYPQGATSPAPVDPIPAPATPAIFTEPVTAPAPAKANGVPDIAQAITAAIQAAMAATSPALDESRIVELIRENSAPVTRISLDPVTVQAPKTMTTHKAMPRVLGYLSKGINVALVGPAGSGKTTIGQQCAELLEKDYYLSGKVESPFQLVGYKDTAGVYHRTDFRDAYEYGGLFCFGELDSSDSRAVVAFNNALDDSGRFAFPDGMVERHEDFIAIADMNTYGNGATVEYVGRNPLDVASKDRFAFITMDYDENLESAIGQNPEWTRYVQKVRAAVRTLGLRHIVSPRASIKGAIALTIDGETYETVSDSMIWKGLDADTIGRIKAQAGV
jgi:energy-coupling factor transporter ATP-binding protein EcfA2